MSAQNVPKEVQNMMESTEKGELEDGEIEDETGLEVMDGFDMIAVSRRLSTEHDRLPTRSRFARGRQFKFIPPLMSVPVTGGGSREESPSRYFRNYSESVTGKHPSRKSGSKTNWNETSGQVRGRKRTQEENRDQPQSRESWTTGGSGPKRRKETAKETMSKRKSSQKRDERQRARGNRGPLARDEGGPGGPSDEDAYETLLRKHHEVQELIKQEKEKLTSGGTGHGGQSSKVKGQAKPKRARGQRSSSKLAGRSRSRSGLAKEVAEVHVPTSTSLTEAASDDEVVEVQNDASDEIIEIVDDDDELLHLRLLALESATKNVTEREEKENQTEEQSQRDRSSSYTESKRAKQRERRRKVKQLFEKQGVAAEIAKVHGEKERFNRFMDFVTSRSSYASQGSKYRRSPSIGKESSKSQVLESSTIDTVTPAKEFQFDNYDEVEMEVSEIEESPIATPVAFDTSAPHEFIQGFTGSETDTSVTIGQSDGGANDVAMVAKDDEDEDDDEEAVMALREQLLRSLATKRAAKAQAKEQTEVSTEEYIPDEPIIRGPVYEPSPIITTSSSDAPIPFVQSIQQSSSPQTSSQSPFQSSSPATIKPVVAKAKVKVQPPAIPTHKPVVIQFGDDTDSSDDEHTYPSQKVNQISLLDQFLKEERRKVDAQKNKSRPLPYPNTPEVMQKLPEVQRAEYRKLKEEIYRREQIRLGKLTPSGGGSPGTQSPIKDVSICITKIGDKMERKVVVKESKLKDKEGKAEEVPVKSDLMNKDKQQVIERQVDLAKHRMTAEKDCRILSALEKRLQKGSLSLRQMEVKLKRLRDDLAVGEIIAASHRSQIKKYNLQRHLIQNKVREHMTKETELRESLATLKGVAIGEVGQSQLLLQVAHRIPTTAVVNGGKQKVKANVKNTALLPASGSSESELKRLQRLEREYAKKLELLREVSSKQAATRMKPVPTAVRILTTKTKLLNKKPSTQLLLKDKIVLGNDTPTNTDSESDVEKYLRTQTKRRRSFLDDNPSLRPNLSSKSVPLDSKKAIKPTTSRTNTHSSDLEILKRKVEKAKDSSQSTSSKHRKDKSSTSTKRETLVEGLTMPSDEQIKRLKCALSEKSKTALDFTQLASHFGIGLERSVLKEQSVRRMDEIKMRIINDEEKDEVEEERLTSTLMKYRSPLLRFRSYRLSPFFVKEAKLSRLSPSFSHKLDPMKVLCKFELNGTCNDDDCLWQHMKDYELSDHEIYADILAYTPVVANSKDWQIEVKREQRVVDYINKAVKKSKKPENAKKQREALCRAFANAVTTNTKKTSSGVVISQPRSWSPQQAPTNPPPSDSTQDPPIVPRSSKQTVNINVVPLGGEDSERYYLGDEIAELEAAVVEQPNDVKMWLKLASRLIGDHSEKADIDRGLNALSRGLEANQSSSELWIHYLCLYSKRDDHSDLMELSQQALQFAPSYDLYWQCLGFEDSFSAKDAICEKMISFFQSDESKNVTIDGSHGLLEVLVYRVQLYIMTRRVKKAILVLKDALLDPGSSSQFLTSSDRCLAWLIYIHVIEFQRLPSQLFDPTGSGLGQIVCKRPLIFQWDGYAAVHSAEGVHASFQALKACSNKDQSASDNIKDCMPLHRNLVMLEQLAGKHEKAEKLCMRLLDECPHNPDVWMLLIEVHKHQGSSHLDQIMKKALHSCPLSAELYGICAKYSVLHNDPNGAVDVLKLCPYAFYNIQEKSEYKDAQQIRNHYRSLLGQSLSLEYSPPKLNPGVTSELLEEQSCHLWLNYCLLQELTSEESEASEAYEKSLCHLSQTSDAQKLWIEYLLFKKSRLASSLDKHKAFKTFTGLVNRCLVSMATEFPLPQSRRKTWQDYSFHNGVVELYIRCLEDGQQLDMYETYIDRMPHNVYLAFRACCHGSKSLSDRGCIHRVKRIAVDILSKYPECLPFWKVIIALSLHQGKLTEFFLLEVVNDRQPDNIRKLVLKCRELKVNIEDYLKTILQ
ncbi:zinc finger C3H1 domain-containing protein-like [Asterias amurensis]|uniref:zinc finger C3H1 domain-containing protein-like n=1 Tax=Asterias amurensis TaxID=7602 RepID=UPI003AB22CC1